VGCGEDVVGGCGMVGWVLKGLGGWGKVGDVEEFN